MISRTRTIGTMKNGRDLWRTRESSLRHLRRWLQTLELPRVQKRRDTKNFRSQLDLASFLPGIYRRMEKTFHPRLRCPRNNPSLPTSLRAWLGRLDFTTLRIRVRRRWTWPLCSELNSLNNSSNSKRYHHVLSSPQITDANGPQNSQRGSVA
jgi:hypothetical protein